MTEFSLSNSMNLMQRAVQVIPGGVNSPVRAFSSVGGQPVFFKRGLGPYLYDVDGNAYVDYVGSWGPLILGHAHPRVIDAVVKASQNGLSFGAPTAVEVEIAELISHLMPSIEMLRMVNSGTEATMSAIRLARAYTKRNKIIKFDSCYHGHNDSTLVKAGSGILTLGIAGCAGVTAELAQQTLVAPYNDLSATQDLFAVYGEDIAAIIVEPIAANNNLILPKPRFLAGLRALCDKYRSVLIFDEVITGFRVGLGGAQGLYKVRPDLTCLGKIIGGGMPVGAFGGNRDIMQMLAPLGPVYQAGTLSGNPVSMAAGLATIKELLKPGVYEQLDKTSAQIMQTFAKCAHEHDIELDVKWLNGVFGFSFQHPNQSVLFNTFFKHMLQQGVYLAPSSLEVGFVSLAHDTTTLDITARAAYTSFAQVSNKIMSTV